MAMSSEKIVDGEGNAKFIKLRKNGETFMKIDPKAIEGEMAKIKGRKSVCLSSGSGLMSKIAERVAGAFQKKSRA